jgi:hypothetical protein
LEFLGLCADCRAGGYGPDPEDHEEDDPRQKE